MLTCVHHPIDAMRVVEEDEANSLKATGLWFDCPRKAKAYREKVEAEIKEEAQVIEPPKDKTKRKPK
jgi:hypothetical protein